MLKGNQGKLDVNKNGRLDSEDFKMLRAGKKKKKVAESSFIERVVNILAEILNEARPTGRAGSPAYTYRGNPHGEHVEGSKEVGTFLTTKGVGMAHGMAAHLKTPKGKEGGDINRLTTPGSPKHVNSYAGMHHRGLEVLATKTPHDPMTHTSKPGPGYVGLGSSPHTSEAPEKPIKPTFPKKAKKGKKV